MAHRRFVRTVDELAAALNVHRTTASRWLRDGAPRRADGRFDTAAVAKWARSRRSRGARTARNGGVVVEDLGRSDELAAADAELREARLALERQILAEERDRWFPRAQVPAMLDYRRRLFTKLIEDLIRRVAPALARSRDETRCADILEAGVNDLFDRLPELERESGVGEQA